MTEGASSPGISSGAAPEDAPAHEHAAWPPLMNASRERYSIGSPSPARRAICAPGSCCLCQGPDRPTGRHGSRCSFPCLAPQWLTKAPSAGHLGATHWGHQHRQPSQAKLARATKPAAHPPRLFSSAPMQSIDARVAINGRLASAVVARTDWLHAEAAPFGATETCRSTNGLSKP